MDQMSLLAPFVMLGLLAIIASHPVIGLSLMILITVWPFLKWAGRLWLEGFIWRRV